jgi:isoleucyl-tRNA synthetase
MAWVRRVATLALTARAQSGVKVRQPLLKLEVLRHGATEVSSELIAIIRDEVNVKQVQIVDKYSQGPTFVTTSDGALSVTLDTELTDELRHDGEVRDLIRCIQEQRQAHTLVPQDRVSVTVWHAGDESFGLRFVGDESRIKQETNCTELVFTDKPIRGGAKAKLNDMEIGIAVKKTKT